MLKSEISNFRFQISDFKSQISDLRLPRLDPRSSAFIRGCFLFILAAFTAATRAAESTTAPKTPEGAFEVQEWVIFLCDPNQPQANAATLFNSTLPDFIGGRRNPAPVDKESEPGPIGVIRFTGAADIGKEKLDLLLQNKGGRFLATWPKAQTRSSGVLWQNFQLAAAPPASQEQLGAANWMNALRAPAAPPFLLKEGRGERFLLYDAEPKYILPLKLSAGEGARQYVISNNEKTAPLRDLTFYKNEPEAWYTATLDSLAPSKSPATAAATKPATRAAAATAPSTGPAAAAAVAAATRPATTTHAASQPSSTKPAGQIIALQSTGLKDAAQLLGPWKQRLTSAGLAPTDQPLILAILKKHALDEHRLTAVYRIDPDQFEQLMPLEVTPQPRRTTRVALVIVKNIDPAIITEVETLVQQLGDPKWDNREAAHKRLVELGPAARPKLEAMLKTAKDPEIVYRIDRLIATLTKEPAPGENANPNQAAR